MKYTFNVHFRQRKVIFKICWKQRLSRWLKLIVSFHSTGVGGLSRKLRYDDVLVGCKNRSLSMLIMVLGPSGVQFGL